MVNFWAPFMITGKKNQGSITCNALQALPGDVPDTQSIAKRKTANPPNAICKRITRRSRASPEREKKPIPIMMMTPIEAKAGDT